jgi:hypothetical protein
MSKPDVVEFVETENKYLETVDLPKEMWYNITIVPTKKLRF